jgi:hypothetical protein
MRRRQFAQVCLALVAALGAAPSIARAEWTNLAIRTSGTVLQPGDQLRVELVALEPVTVPFTAEVVYRWAEPVTVRDEDGHESQEMRGRSRTSPRTAVIDHLDRFKTVLLDDSFFFGSGCPAEQYAVEVNVHDGSGGSGIATLRSAVFCKAYDKSTTDSTLVVSGVKAANSSNWVTLDGTFPPGGVYTVILFDETQLVAFVDTGINPTSPHTLDIVSPVLSSFQRRVLDLVVIDRIHDTSSTLARFTMPRPL